MQRLFQLLRSADVGGSSRSFSHTYTHTHTPHNLAFLHTLALLLPHTHSQAHMYPHTSDLSFSLSLSVSLSLYRGVGQRASCSSSSSRGKICLLYGGSMSYSMATACLEAPPAPNHSAPECTHSASGAPAALPGAAMKLSAVW